MAPVLVLSLLLAAQPPEPGRRVRVEPAPAADKPDDLQTVLAYNPDVQIAEAELRLAQAKLAKARQLAAQAVTVSRAKLEQARAALTQAQLVSDNTKALAKQNVVPDREVRQAEAGVAAVKATVAAAEAEVRALAGSPTVYVDGVPLSGYRATVVPADAPARDAAPAPLPTGPNADKLRAALDAPLKLDLPADAKLQAVCDALAPALTPSGLSLRAPVLGPADELTTAGSPLKGQRPLREWLEVVADTFSNRTVPMNTGEVLSGGGRTQRSIGYVDLGRREFFVRDYGLLFADTKRAAPPGAVTVGEFVRRLAAVEASDKATTLAKAETVAKPPSKEVLDRVKAALGEVVKLPAMSKQKPAAVYEAVFAAAGLKLKVIAYGYPEEVTLDVEAGEQPVAAWVEMLLDQRNADAAPGNRIGVFVRDYGLLVVKLDDPQPGAVPLFQLK